MQYLLVKNWREFQHYKKRNPPWIKLHRAIIEDYAFAALKDKTKAHLMLIWILAAASEGRIPNDAVFLAKRINAAESVDLTAMIEAGFLLTEDGEKLEHPAQQPTPAARKLNGELRNTAKRILAFLNEKAGKNFHETDTNLGFIEARLGEYDENTLRGVIVDRVDEWKSDHKMHQYLRPETLFNKTKCDQYVGGLPK